MSAETPQGRGRGDSGSPEGDGTDQEGSGKQGSGRQAGPGPVRLGPPAGASGVGQLPFDQALAELQGVVSKLETGGLPLEESIALYERGVALHDHCARLLGDAELRVQRLVEQAGGSLRAIDLSPEDETP